MPTTTTYRNLWSVNGWPYMKSPAGTLRNSSQGTQLTAWTIGPETA